MNKFYKYTTPLLLGLMLGLVACEDPAFEFDAQGDPNEVEGLLLQYVIGQIARPVFYRSYNYQAASGYCRNSYKIPLLDHSSTDAACDSDSNCTVQTTRCVDTSNVGACVHGATLESWVEDVYYTATYNASSALSACTSLSGRFSSTYTQ